MTRRRNKPPRFSEETILFIMLACAAGLGWFGAALGCSIINTVFFPPRAHSAHSYVCTGYCDYAHTKN